jgi:hypothetical protein
MKFDSLMSPEHSRAAALAVGAASYVGQLVAATALVRRAHRRLVPAVPIGGTIPVPGVLAFGLVGCALFLGIDYAALSCMIAARSVPSFLWFAAAAAGTASLACLFWLTLPALAVDGQRLAAAFARGRRLTSGSRFPVFALLAVLLVGQWGANALAAVVVTRSVVTELLVISVLGALLIPVKSCTLAAAYRELCLAKEGPREEELGEVFA